MPKLRIYGGQYELIVNLILTVSLVDLLFIDFKNGSRSSACNGHYHKKHEKKSRTLPFSVNTKYSRPSFYLPAHNLAEIVSLKL